jgi:nucleoside-diphosphate-sugar epimerase
MRVVLGSSPVVQHAPARAREIQRSCLDVSKAAREGLWRPRTTLEDGLGRTARLA